MASPFLKWAGGKGRLVPRIAAADGLFESSRFIEPFLGGGAVLFGIRARGFAGQVLANDLNKDLVGAYKAVRDHTEELLEVLSRLSARYLTAGELERESMYYEIRGTQFNDAVHQAARLIFLNRTCFNGLYRVNRRGEFNVPHGDYANPRICDADGLRACKDALEGVVLSTTDFAVVCAAAGSGDFVYLDPPYQPLSKTSSFTSYTDSSFGAEEQFRLARSVRALDARGARFVLSNSAHPYIAELYSGFLMHQVEMARNINSLGDHRQPVTEFLISNVEIRSHLLELQPEVQPQPNLQIA